ncbi:unnamed protein product [Rotaria sp. Silwood2]|nr:unnamed protein product [Rotaria sp. Silwood2]
MEVNKMNDIDNNDLPIIRVAGVPEHFNEPWRIGLEKNLFKNEGIDIEWYSVKEGTGSMINKLKSNEVDVIVALTEGLINDIANGSDIRLLGTYVQSPLVWSVSTGANSIYNSIEDLKGEKFGISRYQSGSHLMSCVLANQYGWKQSDLEFIVCHNFDNLRKSVNDNTTAAFIWEYFMQKPYYDKGEIRRIGQIITPWPCFMIASTTHLISKHLNDIKKMFIALEKACLLFQTNSIDSIKRISINYGLNEEDAKAWFDKVIITPTNTISESTIETTLDALKTAHLLNNENAISDPIRFIDTRFTKLTVDIKSMRLYNKPELLITLRNNLRVAGISKGPISYIDLLPYDQNHYYGTQVLDLAVNELKLNQYDQNSNWFIQIGSNLAGCARYLAGKYQLKVLAIELQNDLSQTASELTERCRLSNYVHHIAGNFLNVAEHLQENFYYGILSWITILHFNQNERIRLIDQSYRLLKENGFFYLEDFIRIGNISYDESIILEHDLYYLKTKMASTTTGKIAEFRRLLSRAHSVLVLTGAGISAESGIPTFRGAGGLWRQYRATDLATATAFSRSPSLVWEFYHYRRELVRTKQPNKAHIALAEAEANFEKKGKRFNVITQNVDGLHRRAGTKNLIEMHGHLHYTYIFVKHNYFFYINSGNLFMVQCTSCGFIEENNSSPICESLRNRGLPDENGPDIDENDLPRCRKCKCLVRPHIVWFGERIWDDVLETIEKEIQLCDLFLVVGTSSVVYPAAGYASILAQKNIPIAEVNVETTPSTSIATYHFHGPAAQLLPQLLLSNINDE